eukprot:7947884-Lingulodinium_polyedra.AAC.1
MVATVKLMLMMRLYVCIDRDVAALAAKTAVVATVMHGCTDVDAYACCCSSSQDSSRCHRHDG